MSEKEIFGQSVIAPNLLFYNTVSSVLAENSPVFYSYAHWYYKGYNLYLQALSLLCHTTTK